MDGKKYICAMFPYPSGRLHMGHARNYSIADAIERRHRRQGFKTLFPMGWDSFGLPAEKAAVERGVDPAEWTASNVAAMRVQMDALGYGFDWSREISTCDPAYYKHGQAIFVALFKAGLIAKEDKEVWFDPHDQDVLADEQVVDGLCWRSGVPAERRTLPMWHAKVAPFARELAEGLQGADWAPEALARQKAWIGFDPETGHARLRDWCVSRQRRWGTPVPVCACPSCGEVPADPATLPWTVLPPDPSEADRTVACPACSSPALRSAETLDTFWDSAWYFLRYPEIGTPGADERPFGPGAAEWAPVDIYVGGMEHATMHLLYARWMCKALASIGWPAPKEPFVKYIAQGMVKSKAWRQVREGGSWVAPSEIVRARSDDGSVAYFDASGEPAECVGSVKMSKSKLNGEDIQAVAEAWGADAANLALLFAAPFAKDVEWDSRSCKGPRRFLDELQKLAAWARDARSGSAFDGLEAERRGHAKAWDSAWAKMDGVNAAIGWSMRLLSAAKAALEAGDGAGARAALLDVCWQLWPCAPASCEAAGKACDPEWSPFSPEPEFGASAPAECAVQIDGRTVGRACFPKDGTDEALFAVALAKAPRFEALASGRKPLRVIHKPGRAVNFVMPPA